VSAEGLNEAPEMAAVLLDRARALSRDPAREDVLVLAHGPGEDAENERWLAYLDRLAEQTRSALPFHRVQVATLREDWPEKRTAAERAVREFVESSRGAGRRALVIPFRVEGFGPYADVLEGLDYSANELGLLPHSNVTTWIRRQALELRSAEFSTAVTPHAEP
jgi:sirohydrochlorin cobaltochelatase